MMDKRLFGLLAIAFIISNCIVLIDSAPISVVAQSLFPTPTSTPQPTTTPVPTPRPVPSAKPTMELYCTSTATQNNLKIEVTGTLTYNKTGIPDAAVYLSYSDNSADNWTNFTLVKTNANGGFGALWSPKTTGNYLVCASWEGNETLRWMNATVNLALASDGAGNVFSVASNSSISGLAYDAASQQLSFRTNGTASTTGYAYVSVPKTLVSDAQTLKVNIDGTPIAFSSESKDDVWVICCVYSQSVHTFVVQIPFMQVITPETTPWITIAIIAVVLVIVISLLVIIQRRRRTAATVAAILKENQQSP